MPGAHRDTDSRFCGATTTVIGQSTVFVNELLWAVHDDPNTHADGQLVPVYGPKNVYAEEKLIIVAIGDVGRPDKALHPGPPTDPAGCSGDVNAYA